MMVKHLKFVTILFTIFGAVLVAFLSLLKNPQSNTNAAHKNISFEGEIKTGHELHIDYCAEGYYLETTEGKTLLLRTATETSDRPLFTDASFEQKKVLVNGIYPAQEYFCEALLCDCEDYILVEEVTLQ
jgi:hypothetical protein